MGYALTGPPHRRERAQLSCDAALPAPAGCKPAAATCAAVAGCGRLPAAVPFICGPAGCIVAAPDVTGYPTKPYNNAVQVVIRRYGGRLATRLQLSDCCCMGGTSMGQVCGHAVGLERETTP